MSDFKAKMHQILNSSGGAYSTRPNSSMYLRDVLRREEMGKWEGEQEMWRKGRERKVEISHLFNSTLTMYLPLLSETCVIENWKLWKWK